MMHTVDKRISSFGESLETLRANRKVSYALILGIAAVAGLTTVFWQVVMIGSEIHAYIDTHGWTAAMERLDEVTAPLWKGKDK